MAIKLTEEQLKFINSHVSRICDHSLVGLSEHIIALPFADSEKSEDAIPVIVYTCMKCGRIYLYDIKQVLSLM